jgi:hypothetical protein
MPITASNNPQYGGTLITEKYTPLAGIAWDTPDPGFYPWLLTFRATQLRNAGLLGAELGLAVPQAAGVVAAEQTAHRQPPLVVVSSGRSGWIGAGLAAAAANLADLGLGQFDGVSDWRAITNSNGQSPPLYTPTRVGGNRGIYIVVHAREFATYRAALANTGVVPVAWSFRVVPGSPANRQLTGFGPTRFAAMEFLKKLRREAQPAGGVAPWDVGWIIDDNVIGLGNFPGFAALENVVTASIGALGELACIGLGGCTTIDPYATSWTWAKDQADHNYPPANLANFDPQGIVQQAALWNVAMFDRLRLNFAPSMLTSAEDTSLSFYLTKRNIPYRFYSGIGIQKELAAPDTGGGAAMVGTYRGTVATFVTAEESGAAQPPPPPVEVTSGGTTRTVFDFVVQEVLPKSSYITTPGAPGTQVTAASQAVEQISAGAMSQGLVPAAVMDTVVKINGANLQQVDWRQVP